VFIITIDTVRSRLLREEESEWAAAPEMNAFFARSVWLRRAITPRGYTKVALSSLLTGGYPREHGLRTNELQGGLALPTLAERFSGHGYTTIGYAANACGLLKFGFTEQACGDLVSEDTGLNDQEALEQDRNDQLLLETFGQRVALLPEDEPVFIWVHLNQPHYPFHAVSPWYEQFHPEPYEGPIDPGSNEQLYQVALGFIPYTDADRRHLEATYASELRATDERFGAFLGHLEAAGRLDDAIVVLGADHGEELMDHNDYAFHGCSPYDSVLSVDFAIRAPGALPQGFVADAPVSLADLAPTIVELAGAFSWQGDVAGRSLVATLQAGQQPSHDVFFERSTNTAGVVRGDWKYILTPEEGYDSCTPYDRSKEVYPAEVEELYDIAGDPGERLNLALVETERRDELSQAVCAWVNEEDWVPERQMSENALLKWCGGDPSAEELISPTTPWASPSAAP